MNAPHEFLSWRIVLPALMASVALIGCGSGSNSTPKAPKVIQSAPIPANVGAHTKPSEQSAAPVAKAPERQANSTPKSKSKSDADPFAEENPKNLFVISGEAPIAVIGTNSDAALINGFTIDQFAPEANSTNFEVLASAGGVSGGNAGASGTSAKNSARNAQFKLPGGFAEVASFGYSDQGLPLRIWGDKSGALMGLVPAGAAVIGSNDGPPDTQPEFSPFLETYYMDVTEVTLEQYAKFREDVKQKKNSNAQPALNDGQNPRLPALGLTWGIAQGFAHWADKELPTEAEFEHAARGPHGWRTPWGNGRAVWPRARTTETIAPVASFLTDQSVYGIYDLAGNAREWCSDYYSDTAHQDAASAKNKTLRNWAGPKKPSVPGQRVVKGNGPDWSAWHRQGRAVTEHPPDVGFRCVLRVKVPQTEDSKGD